MDRSGKTVQVEVDMSFFWYCILFLQVLYEYSDLYLYFFGNRFAPTLELALLRRLDLTLD